jgi:hypothetical protein
MKACKHLDHDVTKYGEACELKEAPRFSVRVLFWRRKELPYEGAPRDVQFCGQGRGRINGIFQCYNPGEMPCHQPADLGAGVAP